MYGDDHIDELIAKLTAGTITEEELRLLVDWYNSLDDTRAVLPVAHGDTVAQLKARIYQRLMAKVKARPKRSIWIRTIPYAAAMLAIALGISFFLTDRPTGGMTPTTVHDIPPGRNRATLILTDGRTVNLSETQEGIVIGDRITYADGSDIVDGEDMVAYNGHSTTGAGGVEKSHSVPSYQLSTPRGGTYQITLPDGTKVWLNAGSILRYPSHFDGETRLVELVGEGYFDVSEQVSSVTGELRPFVVVSRNQKIEVLGTEFNISAYPDDAETKTTLVNGSVRVVSSTGTTLIHPGEQARIDAGGLHVDTVETALFTAWKDGKFHFRKTPLEGVLKQVSRWYDVEVTYTGKMPQETFSGKIRRDVSLMGVLDILRLSAINVELSGRTLLVN